MSKYINANLFKKEIDRIEEEARKVRVSGTDKEAIGADGKVSLCLKLKSLIDSFQQEQFSDDLEEAAERYMQQVEARFLRTLEHPTAKDCFKAGAHWQKVQILEDAIDGYVNYYEDSGGILMAEAQVGCPYHNGDKVKIIIVKEKKK